MIVLWISFIHQPVSAQADKGIQMIRTVNPVSLNQKNADSIQHNYNTLNRKSRISSYIAPAVLIATGTSLHYNNRLKTDIRNQIREKIAWHGYLDDYAQYLPLAAVYTLYASGIHGENNFGNKTAIVLKSFLLNGIITYGLKTQVDEVRPNGEPHSFPSGHASKAFTLAHFMHREYGSVSTWYSIGAYTGAAAVSMMRLAKDEHWISDVIMGAGIGILSTELIYLTHQYKWNNQYLKKLNIFPFKNDSGNGITFIYTF